MEIKFKKYDALIKLADMKPSPYQRNTHTQEQINRLARIMMNHGVRHPISISNRTQTICFGHGRREAALLNNWTEFPVVYQDFENEEEEYSVVQSDNAIAEWSILDEEQIQLDILKFGDDFDKELLGIKDFLKIPDEGEENKNDDDETDAPKRQPESDEPEETVEEKEEKNERIEQNEQIPEKIEHRTKPLDHFKIGNHALMNGDCLERLIQMPSETIDSLVTDPPAGIAFMGKEWDED